MLRIDQIHFSVSDDQIRPRAHQIWVERGRPYIPGHGDILSKQIWATAKDEIAGEMALVYYFQQVPA